MALEWFSSYLSGRFQNVEYNDTISELMPITCGAPRSLVLGPLRFIILQMNFQTLKHSKCIHLLYGVLLLNIDLKSQ